MTKASLRQLVKEEHQLKAALDNVQDFVDGYDEDRDQSVVELRLVKLDSIFDRFCAVRVEIDVLLDETGDYESADDESSKKSVPTIADSVRTYKEFENAYFRLKSALLAKRPRTQPGVIDRQPVAGGVQQSRLKYPELKLPSFSGKLQEWINFRDNFRSLIHDNDDLRLIDKFNYLRASLKDDTLVHINQVQVSTASYPIARSLGESSRRSMKTIS